jgi:acyl-CoA hydrolase
MKTHRLVLQTHLNHYGFLFGGELLKWIDEAGYIAANVLCPGNEFVTVGLSEVVFHKSISAGSILEFDTGLIRKGRSSVTISIAVYCAFGTDTEKTLVFKTEITFVAIDKSGNSIPIISKK